MTSEAFDLVGALQGADGSRDRLQRIIEVYFDEAPLRLAQIHAGVDAQDTTAISAAAHRLAGTLVYLRAAPALAAARRVDDLAVAGDLNGAIQAVAVLEHALGRLESDLPRCQEYLQLAE